MPPNGAHTFARLWPCVGAFMLYGTWAAWVHAAHQADWLQHALLQGCYAFASTLGVQTIALALYRTLSQKPLFAAYAKVLAWACTSLLAVVLPGTLQWLAGSQAILLSIAPGALASSIFIGWVLHSSGCEPN